MNDNAIDSKAINDPEIVLNVKLTSEVMRTSDLSNLTAGEVIMLNQKISENLMVELNGKIIGAVELLNIDGNYAIKIQEIIGG